MIDAEKSIVIDATIANVWAYVQDIRRWADLFPGCRECTVIDEHNSQWILKVGAGGLVRTVKVNVCVDEWAGPERVNFSYTLDAEPVHGNGSYSALVLADNQTEITLHVEVSGSGPMASMWEAVSRPLLPQLAKVFAEKLKTEIETCNNRNNIDADINTNQPADFLVSPSLLTRLLQWLKSISKR